MYRFSSIFVTGHSAWNFSFSIFLRIWRAIYLVNSVDKTKSLHFTPTPTQLPLSFTVSLNRSQLAYKWTLRAHPLVRTCYKILKIILPILLISIFGGLCTSTVFLFFFRQLRVLNNKWKSLNHARLTLQIDPLNLCPVTRLFLIGECSQPPVMQLESCLPIPPHLSTGSVDTWSYPVQSNADKIKERWKWAMENISSRYVIY